MPPDKSAAFKKRRAHPDAELLGLFRAGNNASIIIGKHHHRAARQGRVKHALAGNIKIIAVNQGNSLRGSITAYE